MVQSNIKRMFQPRGIAIVGANTDESKPGRQTILALDRHGYVGGIYPVNPKYEKIAEHRCFPTLDAIDGECDVAVIALPAAHVPGVISQCGKKGIGYAVVLGGGFREAGLEGVALERQMLEAAREHCVRIIGPNCLGFKNIHENVFASFGSITRPPDLMPGVVSAVIQSGGFGNSVVNQAAYAGIGFRYVVASGNECDINAPELIEAFVDDPETKVILAYLEGVSDGRAFMSAARRALSAGKPLVVMKAGNTEQGLRASATHTATMTGSYEIFRAAFRQCGAIEVRDITEAVDYLQYLTGGRTARGRNVAVMSGSGGSLVNFADGADEFSLKLGSFTEATRTILSETLPSIATIDNPVDYTAGFNKESNAPRYLKVIEAVLADPGVDQLGLFLASAAGGSFASAARTIVNAKNPESKPIIVYSALPPTLTQDGLAILSAVRIPVLGSPRRIAAAMGMLADYGTLVSSRTRFVGENHQINRVIPMLPESAGTLDENNSKRLLKEQGIGVTKDAIMQIECASPELPAGFVFPVAVKIVSRDIAHKTDIGAVKLNIQNADDLEKAFFEVVANSKKSAPNAELSGVLISEMVVGAVETIVGVVNDPLFGPVVVFGLGGVLAEVLRDTTCRIAPFGIETAREMILELRGAALFSGVRGGRPRDVEAIAKTLVAVSEIAWLLKDRLAEMDINPLLVQEKGKGVIAADALVVLK